VDAARIVATGSRTATRPLRWGRCVGRRSRRAWRRGQTKKAAPCKRGMDRCAGGSGRL